MPVYVNRAHVATTTTGTGTITLGAAVPGFQTFGAAGLVDGNVVSYTIEDEGNAWEVGTGTYSSTGPTLTRTLVQSSTGALLNLTGSARVYVIMSAANMTALLTDVDPGTTGLTATKTGSTESLAGTLVVANGGTGASTAENARANLGLAIGTNVQAYDADLTAIAALSTDDGNIIVGNGTTWVAESGATARASLGAAEQTAQAVVNSGVFYENSQTVTADYTITSGKNAMSAGPITINTGVSVTIPSGSVWTVV